MKYRFKRFLPVFMAIVFFLTVFIPFSECEAASPYVYVVKSPFSFEYRDILSFLNSYAQEEVSKKIQYLLNDSQYAAFSSNRFNYPNNGSTNYYIRDKKDPYRIYSYKIYGGTGCWAYSCFVESFVYGKKGSDGHMKANKTKRASKMPGRTSAQKLKYLVKTYAQPGEHLRVNGVHSVTVIAFDANGFYYTDYWSGGSEPYPISLHYATWSSFVRYYPLNAIHLYECDTSKNNISISDAFPDDNFRSFIKTEIIKKPNLSDETELSDVLPYICEIESLDISDRQINDLTGISHFILLSELNCSHNALSKIDVSKNKYLKSIDFSYNSIIHADFIDNKLLEKLICDYQYLYAFVKKNEENEFFYNADMLAGEKIYDVKGALFDNGKFILGSDAKFPCMVSFTLDMSEFDHEMKVVLIFMGEDISP